MLNSRIASLSSIAYIRHEADIEAAIFKNKVKNDLGNCLEEDYIKNPKNGYKSIHLNYLVEKNIPLEIQIKTKQMKVAQDIVHDKIYKNFSLSEDLRNVLSKLAFLKILKQ